MIILGAGINALTFVEPTTHLEKVVMVTPKRNVNEKLEKLYRAKDKWNENRVKRLDFLNQRLRIKQKHT